MVDLLLPLHPYYLQDNPLYYTFKAHWGKLLKRFLEFENKVIELPTQCVLSMNPVRDAYDRGTELMYSTAWPHQDPSVGAQANEDCIDELMRQYRLYHLHHLQDFANTVASCVVIHRSETDYVKIALPVHIWEANTTSRGEFALGRWVHVFLQTHCGRRRHALAYDFKLITDRWTALLTFLDNEPLPLEQKHYDITFTCDVSEYLMAIEHRCIDPEAIYEQYAAPHSYMDYPYAYWSDEEM